MLAEHNHLENDTHRVLTVIKSRGLFITLNYVLADLQGGLSFLSLYFVLPSSFLPFLSFPYPPLFLCFSLSLSLSLSVCVCVCLYVCVCMCLCVPGVELALYQLSHLPCHLCPPIWGATIP